ncbi:phage major capsid protein [Psychrobacillus sp. FSL K6-2684]|uniref:phage major capsid protein n=1 Tax=Psychrobacillus sp. FSL K6-2684 TaxID=2921547 RepID=UPI0030FBE67A
MNKKLLLALQKRTNARLTELRGQLERNEVRAEDLEEVQEEVQELADQAQEVADALANLSEDDGGGTGADSGDEEDRGGEDGEADADDEPEQRTPVNVLDPEQRTALMKNIAKGLSTRGHKSTAKKQLEIRSAFAKFVVGHISEYEARALGVETNNGSVVIPEVVANEIITYAQEENLLRKYGTAVRTKGNVKYPVLVKKAVANVVKKERHIVPNPIQETDIEFDEIYLSPVEFDALATISKKLINMSDSNFNVEDIVIEELKKAYVRKETNYMFNGNDAGNENPGALAKKAVAYYESAPVDLTQSGLQNTLYKELVKMKGQVTTEVRKKAMWILNGAAVTVLEGLLDGQGRPLLYDTGRDEVGYKLLGHKVDFTDAADGTDPTKPIFYFGDFKTFRIQDVIGALQIQKLIEKYSDTNRIGFQIYNLLDGQLVYSPFEPSVYRYEVGATAPVGG